MFYNRENHKIIVINGIYNYTIFVTNDKYHKVIWTSNHLLMIGHIYGLKLEC